MNNKLKQDIDAIIDPTRSYDYEGDGEIDKIYSLIKDVSLAFAGWGEYSDYINKKEAFNYFIKNIYGKEN